jgi:hypothetical protein
MDLDDFPADWFNDEPVWNEYERQLEEERRNRLPVKLRPQPWRAPLDRDVERIDPNPNGAFGYDEYERNFGERAPFVRVPPKSTKEFMNSNNRNPSFLRPSQSFGSQGINGATASSFGLRKRHFEKLSNQNVSFSRRFSRLLNRSRGGQPNLYNFIKQVHKPGKRVYKGDINLFAQNKYLKGGKHPYHHFTSSGSNFYRSLRKTLKEQLQ